MTQTPEYKYFLDEQNDKQSEKLFFKFAIALFVIYAIVFGSVYIYHSNFQYVTINGLSMQPTLNANPVFMGGEDVQDGVYVKLTHKANYGDIIVINKTEEDSIIKRALAFGGDYVTIASIGDDDTIDYRFMRVKSGSQEVEILNEEDYILSYDYWNLIASVKVDDVNYENILYSRFNALNYQTKTFEVEINGQDRSVVFFRVPEDNVFFMGDNRTGSSDARMNGTMPQDKILGHVVKIVKNGTIKKQNSFSWFFQEVGDFFSIVWREIQIFFGAKP